MKLYKVLYKFFNFPWGFMHSPLASSCMLIPIIFFFLFGYHGRFSFDIKYLCKFCGTTGDSLHKILMLLFSNNTFLLSEGEWGYSLNNSQLTWLYLENKSDFTFIHFFTVVDQHCWADCRLLRKVFSASVGSSDLQVTANRSSVGFCAQLIRSLSAYFGHETLLLGLSVLWFIFIGKEDVWHMTKSWSLWVSFSPHVLENAAFCHHK